MQQPSRWQFRKQIQRQCRDHDKARIRYLESLLDLHGIDYEIAFSSGPHPLNLERYVEKLGKSVRCSSNLEPNHTVVNPNDYSMTYRSSAVDSTTELARTVVQDVVPERVHEETTVFDIAIPRDTRNPLQCQICRERFESKAALFRHLREECLKGELARTAVCDRQHRRRWKMRARKRKQDAKRVASSVQAAGGHMSESSSTSVAPLQAPVVNPPSVEQKVKIFVAGTAVEVLPSEMAEKSFYHGPKYLLKPYAGSGPTAESWTVKDIAGNPIKVAGCMWNYPEVEFFEHCCLNGRRLWCERCKSLWGYTYDFKSNRFNGAKPRAMHTWYDCATCCVPMRYRDEAAKL